MSDEPLSPVPPDERIEALDVVRGFALIGIFLMNVEFFNRSLGGIEDGMPVGLTGINWLASWFVAYFVQGKFWTIFSLLFGMGFAVMLSRAERAERPFIAPYVRRTLALAVFGALHFILLWTGDILFSYAVGAAGLLVLVYGRWKWIVVTLVALVGLGLLSPVAWAVGGSLAFISLLAIYLRSERKIARMPVFSFIFAIVAALGTILSVMLWLAPDVPTEGRIIVTAVIAVLAITAVLSARYHDPIERRPLRMGMAIYVAVALMMSAVGVVQYATPPNPDDAVSEAKHAEHEHEEERILSTGTYAEAVEMRASEFPDQIASQAGFAVIVIGMFLIGVWFVRSGVMMNPSAHLRLFRRLALYGLPLGIGLGLLGSLIATSHTPGSADGFQLARALAMLGSLPASVGYVGLVVVALHSKTVFAKVRVLAPVGRMALTNYLTQTLVSTSIFYGYGGGQWGLARSWQIVYVACVFALQVVFSHWWLSRFRYGPMEWVWRAFTYLKLPAMRLATTRSASVTVSTTT